MRFLSILLEIDAIRREVYTMNLVQPVGREFKEEVADYSTIKSSCRCSTNAAIYSLAANRVAGSGPCRCADGNNSTVGLRVNIG